MTGTENAGGAADALAIRAMAQDWVVERRAGSNWSDAQQEKLDQWLAQSPAHLIAYWRMEAAWESAQRLAAVDAPMRQISQGGRSASRSHWGKFAAGIALVAALAVAGVTQFGAPEQKVYATPVGGQMTIKLADGSEIQLNTNSRLRLSPDRSRRQATLEKGEAYFAIKHDAKHPFELTAAGHLVTDLGTKFSVQTTDGKLEVALIEGMAKIESLRAPAKSTTAILRPGDVALATATTLSLKATPLVLLQEQLSWRQGILTFKNVTLAEAAATFNRYNDTQIVIADPSVGKLTLYGTFPTGGVTAFADAAQAYFNLRVKNRKGEIVISR